MNRTNSLVTKARSGDRESEKILIEENLPLVHSCVKKLWHDGVEYEDMVQLGCIGLVKAVRRFDVNFGVAFSTYAVPLILGEIRRFLRDDGIIKVSRSFKEIKNKALCASEELSITLQREPSVSELAEFIGETPEKLVMAMDACSPCDSLQRGISPDGNGEFTIGDTIKDKDTCITELEKISLKIALESLKPRDRKIIILRYFMGKTQAEISKIIGVSQVQISRIEKKVLFLLRSELE